MSRILRNGCVVVCSDGNWAWQSLFVLARSISFEKSGHLDHHLFLSGPVDERILAGIPDSITLHRINTLPADFALGAARHVPPAAMLRISAIEELSQHYQRVIYLDGDVFQAWGTLADLLPVDMQEKPLAAIRDRCQWPQDDRHRFGIDYIAALARKLDLTNLDYFNSGVLMVDGPRYLQCDIAARALRFLVENPDLCRFGDQSALNAATVGNWCELSPGWNWQMSRKSASLVAGRLPRLIHFTGEVKPWNDQFRLLPQEVFGAMAAFLAARDWTDLLPADAPSNFDFRTMERQRVKLLDKSSGKAFAAREVLKSYLERTDFADTAAGISAFYQGAALRPT